MRKPIGGVNAVVVCILAAAFSGCAPNQNTRTTTADSIKADEAAIRRTMAETERRINQGDLGFVDVFAKDAAIMAPSAPDLVGYDAIRAAYEGALKQASMEVHFSTEEVTVAGDLAYERGTYTLRMVDRASGKVLQDVKNRHIHIVKRQTDGTWKTWRMMTNSAVPTTASRAPAR